MEVVHIVGERDIQHRQFVRLWDLMRVGWVDRDWWRGRGPKWPLFDVRCEQETKYLGHELGHIPGLIDMV